MLCLKFQILGVGFYIFSIFLITILMLLVRALKIIKIRFMGKEVSCTALFDTDKYGIVLDPKRRS